MRNVIWKLRVLNGLLRSTFDDWHTSVWLRDPDTPYCCPGTWRDECACGGMTIRDLYTPSAPHEDSSQ